MADPDIDAELARVGGLIDDERWGEALRALGSLRRTAPGDPAVWRSMATALRGAGELTEAQFATDQWLSLDSNSIEALRFKADLLGQRGKHYAAVETSEEITARVPDDADAWYQLAEHQRAAGLAARARPAIERSIRLDPLRPEVYELAGVIEMNAGQPAAAAEQFRQSLRLDPDNGRVAQRLQRAIEAQKARPSPKAQAAETKAATKAQAKQTSKRERAEARQRRRAERELGRRNDPFDQDSHTLQSLPRWRKAVALLILVALAALLVLSRFR